jgi:hypothetical protein
MHVAPGKAARARAALAVAQHLALLAALAACIDGLLRAANPARVVLERVAAQRLAGVHAEKLIRRVAACRPACLAIATLAADVGLALRTAYTSDVLLESIAAQRLARVHAEKLIRSVAARGPTRLPVAALPADVGPALRTADAAGVVLERVAAERFGRVHAEVLVGDVAAGRAALGFGRAGGLAREQVKGKRLRRQKEEGDYVPEKRHYGLLVMLLRDVEDSSGSAMLNLRESSGEVAVMSMAQGIQDFSRFAEFF